MGRSTLRPPIAYLAPSMPKEKLDHVLPGSEHPSTVPVVAAPHTGASVTGLAPGPVGSGGSPTATERGSEQGCSTDRVHDGLAFGGLDGLERDVENRIRPRPVVTRRYCGRMKWEWVNSETLAQAA